MNVPSRSQPGTYLARILPLVLGAAALASGFTPPPQQARAQGVFGSQPLDGRRFAILARPVAREDWTLLVLEQVQPFPRCWEDRADGLVDPSLNRFDFSGICSRYLDSNGYSLRIGDLDLDSRYRLRLRQRQQQIELRAFTPQRTTELVVARGSVPLRDRDGFVALTLEPGWQLQRRTYGSQTLSHVYFANPQPLEALLAASSGPGDRAEAGPSLAMPPSLRPPGPPLAEATNGSTGGSTGGSSGGPIALQVIPFRP